MILYRFEVWHEGSCLRQNEYEEYDCLDDCIEEAEDECYSIIEDWKCEGCYEDGEPECPDDFYIKVYAIREQSLYFDEDDDKDDEEEGCVWER